MPTLAGNKQLFHPSIPSLEAPFLSFDRKWAVLIRRLGHYIVYSRADVLFTVYKGIFHEWMKLK